MPMVLTILKVLTEQKKPFSEIVKDYTRSYESGEYNFKVKNAQEIIAAAKNKFKDGEINDMDGIAITYPTWRFSIRTSNTEPLLRLNVESYSKDETEEKKNELINLIKSMSE